MSNRYFISAFRIQTFFILHITFRIIKRYSKNIARHRNRKERRELRCSTRYVVSSLRRTDVGRMYGENVQVGPLFTLSAAASIPML